MIKLNNKLLFSTQSNMFKAGIILFALAVVDSISTDFGLRNSHIEEANPLMRVIYDLNIALFYGLKISLPLFLLILLRKLKPKRVIRYLLGVALLLYSAVLIQHIFWLTLISRLS